MLVKGATGLALLCLFSSSRLYLSSHSDLIILGQCQVNSLAGVTMASNQVIDNNNMHNVFVKWRYFDPSSEWMQPFDVCQRTILNAPTDLCFFFKISIAKVDISLIFLYCESNVRCVQDVSFYCHCHIVLCYSVICTQTSAFPRGLYLLKGSVLDQITDTEKSNISLQLFPDKMAKTLWSRFEIKYMFAISDVYNIDLAWIIDYIIIRIEMWLPINALTSKIKPWLSDCVQQKLGM